MLIGSKSSETNIRMYKGWEKILRDSGRQSIKNKTTVVITKASQMLKRPEQKHPPLTSWNSVHVKPQV